MLQLQQLQVQALQAQAEGRNLRIDTAARAFDGTLQLTVPGASAQVQGRLRPRAGTGEARVQLDTPQRTRDWLAALPGLGALLPGARLQGQARLDARWSGGWEGLQRQLHSAGLVATPPEAGAPSAFTLQAELAAPQLTLAQPASAGQGAIDLQLHHAASSRRAAACRASAGASR